MDIGTNTGFMFGIGAGYILGIGAGYFWYCCGILDIFVRYLVLVLCIGAVYLVLVLCIGMYKVLSDALLLRCLSGNFLLFLTGWSDPPPQPLSLDHSFMLVKLEMSIIFASNTLWNVFVLYFVKWPPSLPAPLLLLILARMIH